jgi:PEP-CTERM motif
MNLKKLAVASAIAVAASGSFAASPSVTVGSDGTVGFGLGGVTGATFSDTWTFMVGTYAGAPPFKFESSLTSFDGVKFTEVVLNGTFSFDILNSGNLSVASGTSISGALPWTLTIKGTTDGLGSYGGQLSVTPVPEPETYALMLAGLGAIGFMARRRRS